MQFRQQRRRRVWPDEVTQLGLDSDEPARPASGDAAATGQFRETYTSQARRDAATAFDRLDSDPLSGAGRMVRRRGSRHRAARRPALPARLARRASRSGRAAGVRFGRARQLRCLVFFGLAVDHRFDVGPGLFLTAASGRRLSRPLSNLDLGGAGLAGFGGESNCPVGRPAARGRSARWSPCRLGSRLALAGPVRRRGSGLRRAADHRDASSPRFRWHCSGPADSPGWRPCFVPRWQSARSSPSRKRCSSPDWP